MKSVLVDASYDEGTVQIEYDVDSTWCNPLGFVQGGAVASMLDGCIGMAGTVKSGGVMAMPLAEMKTSFLRGVPAGRVIGTGKVVKYGRTLVFIESALRSPEGKLLATATGTALPTPFAPPAELPRPGPA